jgi:hypothetical protein
MVEENMLVKRCTKCGKEKPATEEYYYRMNYRSGRPLRPNCRECQKDARRKYGKAHIDKIKAYNKAYKLKKHYPSLKDPHWVESCAPGYIKVLLRARGIKSEDITPEMIESKKTEVMAKRAMGPFSLAERNRKMVDGLTDTYVKMKLVSAGIERENITPELIEIKRQSILLARELKQAIQTTKEVDQ